MRHFLSKYGGIIIGSLYGLAMRIIFEVGFKNLHFEFVDLFSVTFVWVVPVIIGIIPMIFATKEQLSSIAYRFSRPVLAVLLFFLFCFWSRIEDIICIVIISIPFLLGSVFGGFVFAEIIKRYRQQKGIIWSVFIIPLLSGYGERQFPTPTKIYEIRTPLIINSTAENIWENVVRVRQIKETEYSKGFFNYAGIPRPLYAALDKDTIGATRIGHFEEGLIFKETVTTWNRNKKVAFDIQVIPSSIRKTIFDQHILNGDHFRFLNAAYELRQINDKQTELVLTSSYQLDTKINLYGAYWGNQLLADFQERLLEVIKKRCEYGY